MCPIEKIALWEDILYLKSRSETSKGVVKDKVFAQTVNRTRAPGVDIKWY